MYRKIVVAYDGTSHSDLALRQAADLARFCKAELHLLGIVKLANIPALSAEFGGTDIWQSDRNQLEAALQAAVRDIGEKGLVIDSSIREGTPVQEIIDFAHQVKADLVVLGHSDKNLFERWFEGSVGAGLVRHLPCSLLIAAQGA